MKGAILSIAFGAGFLVAAIADYVGHLFGRPSMHPAWVTVTFALLGFLLLFPSRMVVVKDYAIEFLRAWRSK